MRKITIYQFEVYNAQDDQMIKSRRWGTSEAIEQIAHGRMLRNTAVEVDESAVASDIPGLTEKDFIPHTHQGFQTSVQRLTQGERNETLDFDWTDYIDWLRHYDDTNHSEKAPVEKLESATLDLGKEHSSNGDFQACWRDSLQQF